MRPSNEILRSANEVVTTTDEMGRALAVRRPTALDTLRLFKAAGPVLAQNEPWLAIASLACSVQSIDDVPVPMPTNEKQIESIVQKLGDQGLEAIGKVLEQADAALAGVDHLGNLPGTPS
jgi:hypothetical protein